ncbi:MAG: alkaline phosphatase family protein, partial [Planctomycetota bacterium]
MLSRSRAALLFLACVLAFLATLFPSTRAHQIEAPEVPAAAQGPPRLAVLIVFDQMRGDYLKRWQKLYGTGGFRRLCTEGAWFTNCHYPYANTVTAAGHASIATGCSPAEHGIVGNDWYDRRTGEKVNCVADGRYERVPYLPARSGLPLMPGEELERTNISPERLLAPTIGDALKAATHGAGRVVSLSLKERSAVLPAGRHPDACYWFDSGSGLFVTSTYYRERLHPWLVDFNRSRLADRWFGLSWRRLRPDLNYALYSGPDDVPTEGLGIGQGRTFPHSLTVGKPRYYQALTNSPFGNDLLLELARQAIDGEGLGNG